MGKFTFLQSYYDALEGMDALSKGRCLLQLVEYALFGSMPDDLTPAERIYITMARITLDRAEVK